MEMDNNLKKSLQECANNGALLFCGAGFSSSALDSNSKRIGTTTPLLEILNKELDYKFTNIKAAADEYKALHGSFKFQKFLEKKFEVDQIPNDIKLILKYNWDIIYTTNYDNAISLGLKRIGKKFRLINNIESLEKSESFHDLPVIHLHGCAEKWKTNEIFEQSCILGKESYIKLARGNPCIAQFREDHSKSKLVCFVGFSNEDIHIAEEICDLDTKDKVFFINSQEDHDDREVLSNQRNYGQSIAIGLSSLARFIDEIKPSNNRELRMVSIIKEKLEDITPNRASNQDQKDLLVSGVRRNDLLYRDIVDNSQSYRFHRDCVRTITEHIKNYPSSLHMLSGPICSGKTFALEEIITRLLINGKIVFRFQRQYDNFLNEVEYAFKNNCNSVLIIDDCFALENHLKSIIGLATEYKCSLILSSRSLIYDSSTGIKNYLSELKNFIEHEIFLLSEKERDDAAMYINRTGIFKKLIMGKGRECKYLSRILLEIVKSTYAIGKFKKDFEKLKIYGNDCHKTISLAMYLRLIGVEVDETTLSHLTSTDSVRSLKDIKDSAFISFNKTTKKFDLLPSISAQFILEKFFTDKRRLVDNIIEVLGKINELRFIPIIDHISIQIMRYTQFKKISTEKDIVLHFFDRLSEYTFCHRHILFWLQRCMAMRDLVDFENARIYLDIAYDLAKKRYDHFDTGHLDDQKAILLLEDPGNAKSRDFGYKDFLEAMRIIMKSVKKEAPTQHPFQTVLSLKPYLENCFDHLEIQQKKVVISQMKDLLIVIDRCDSRESRRSYLKTVIEESSKCINDCLKEHEVADS